MSKVICEIFSTAKKCKITNYLSLQNAMCSVVPAVNVVTGAICQVEYSALNAGLLVYACLSEA